MSNILVAYFSATGVTEAVAKKISEITGGDLFEILPVIPYTHADLDWRNEKSRSSLEMKDKKSRPQIAGRVEDMTKYDTVYLGFPVWWYTAPTIINTFLEEYSFADKTIVPFVTSGSSDYGKTNGDLLPSCPDAILKDGKRLSAAADENEIKSWIGSL